MTDRVPVALLLPRHATSWTKLSELAGLMVARGDIRPVMLLTSPAMSMRGPDCRAAGIEYIDITQQMSACSSYGSARIDSFLAGISARLARDESIGDFLPFSVLRGVHLVSRYLRERAILRDVCRRLRPGVVVLPGDRELSPVAPMIRAAADLGIPTVIGVSSVATPEAVEMSRRGRPSYDPEAGLLNRLSAALMPDQVLTCEICRILFSPGWRSLALASIGMVSPNPWVQGGGHSTYILHMTQSRREISEQAGVRPGKSIVIGDFMLDRLHRAMVRRGEIARQLRSRARMADGEKLVIVAVPNDAEHGLCSFEEHFRTLDPYFAHLARFGAAIHLAYHPKSRPADYAWACTKYGFSQIEEPLADVLPAADVFVCSASTTITWARVCGLPTIDFDYRGYNVESTAQVYGVFNVADPDAFARAVDALDSLDPAALASEAEAYARNCRFDGQAGARTCEFLKSIAVRNRN